VALVVILAVYLGLAAITVLVVAIDSQGPVDPLLAGQLTWLFFLISQGVAVSFSSILIGIPALSLLFFNLAIIAALSRRKPVSLRTFVTGTLLWTAFTLFVLWKGGLPVHGKWWLSGIKAAGVYAVGYGIAAMPVIFKKIASALETHISSHFLIVLREAFRVTRWCIVAYSVEAVTIVVCWLIMNHEAMGKVFAMTNMPMGSRIVTTLLSLFWLPNLCAWGLSWMFGAGFSLGTLGTFTLWSGSAHDLPPVPIFGILPQAISEEWARTVLLVIPLLTGLIIGFLELASSHGFNYFNLRVSEQLSGRAQALREKLNVRAKKQTRETPRSVSSANASATGDTLIVQQTEAATDYGEDSLGKNAIFNEGVETDEPLKDPDTLSAHGRSIAQLLLVKAVYPLVSFAVSGILLVILSAILFALSNGSLGTGNLASVGVSVASSTQALARPTFSGFLIAWILAVVILTLKILFQSRKRREAPTTSLTDSDLIDVDTVEDK
jgi:hypothetical protein